MQDGTFITATDDSLIWQILPVNPQDSSAGYYYISENPRTQQAKIEKINSSGTLLRVASLTGHINISEALSVSSSHARLSVCSPNGVCFLLDPNTFQSTLLDLTTTTTQISTQLNTQDSGLLVINDHSVVKFHQNGNAISSFAIFREFSKLQCFPRKMYRAFELFDDQMFCTGRPCMRKQTVNSTFYQVSVAVECYGRIVN